VLKAENVTTKGRRRADAPTEEEPRCALCGEPCLVTDLAVEPGWQVQECDCSGRKRRRKDVAAGRLGA